MSSIKSGLVYILISILISSAVMLFSPSSSGGRALKTAAALFVICSFLYPFKEKTDFEDFSFGSLHTEDSSVVEEINSALEKRNEYEIKSRISELFEGMGIKYKTVKVSLFEEDNSLKIKSIEITADSEFREREGEIKEEIMKLYDGECVLKWE